jgi:pimeloyl-ACP methyl ester carboxylesterase
MISLYTFYRSPSEERSLVLLHAFPLSSEMWEKSAALISTIAPNYSIVLADFPGFGHAPLNTSWTLNEAMADLHQKVNAQGIFKPLIGGLSMGGYAAFSYYRLYPADVSALILSNTKPAADSDEGKKDREEFARDVEMRGVDAVYERMLPKLISETSKAGNPLLLPTLKKWIGSSTADAIAACLRTLAARDDSDDLLGKISCPTLAITGEHDAIIPSEEMGKFSEKIRRSQFVQLTGAGHLSAVEDPEAWANAVGTFLNTL